MMDSYYGDGYDMVHQHGQTLWSCGYKYESPDYKGVASVSHDAGSTWTRHELYSGSNYGYVRSIAVDPSDPDRVYCMGYENGSYRVYYTLNGGSSWTGIPATGFSGTPYGMAICPDDGNAIAVASSGGLYSSGNAGVSWSRVTTAFGGANDLIQSAQSDGLLIATADQGVWLWEGWTGTPVQVGSGLGHPDVACLAETVDHLYAGTDGGAAWRSYNGTGIGGQGQEAVNPVTLQILPNPAAGMAVVSFNLPFAQSAGLNLYDLAGRRVMEIPPEAMTQGQNSIAIDVSPIPTGVYLVRLSAEGECETARMVVTR